LHLGIFIEGKSGYDEDIITLKDEKNENHRVSTSHFSVGLSEYEGVDKSSARPGRKQATATEDFDVHMSYLKL
jgi:hypothetical protein